MRHRKELRRVLQSTLIALGYDLGPTGADGKMGPYTSKALKQAAGCYGDPVERCCACGQIKHEG